MDQPTYMQEHWFALLKSRCAGAVHAHIALALGISRTALSMILNGTGPYALTNHVQGNQMTFTKNPDYWGSEPIGGQAYKLPFADTGVSGFLCVRRFAELIS